MEMKSKPKKKRKCKPNIESALTLFCVCVVSYNEIEEPDKSLIMTHEVIVSLKEGKLRGTRNKSRYSGAEFYSFFGVPYGEPPIKTSRFKDPVPVKPWKSIRDATAENRSGCTQFSLYTFAMTGSEDCLYNNIHTRNLPSVGEPLKPVIVCIHPGGYRFGSPEAWHHGAPDSIMHHDVVYIGIAFRLHILGFLNLKMKECSGNQGLKDIILGLKWIKKNIHHFNGDPNNITLFGSSSGGSTIHLLMMSPAAKGLFHKVVMTSFAFIVYANYQDDNEAIAFEIAQMLGFQGNDRKKLLHFLKNVPPESLIPLEREYDKKHEQDIVPAFPQSIFIPTIDSASDNPVIPISPRLLLDSMTPMPLLFGVCERESIIGFSSERLRTTTEKNYKTGYRQSTWVWMHDLSDEEMRMMNDQVEAFYLKDYSDEKVPLPVMVDMITEIAFHDLYDTLINPIAEKLPSAVFLYRFQFESELNFMKHKISSMMEETLSGSYHGCDYSYWTHYDKKKSQRALDMIGTYTKLIATFARNGDPNHEQLGIQWRPSTIENPCYLTINDELKMIDGELFNDSVEFWKNIKRQFRKN